jgi:hypothetical protein
VGSIYRNALLAYLDAAAGTNQRVAAAKMINSGVNTVETVNTMYSKLRTEPSSADLNNLDALRSTNAAAIASVKHLPLIPNVTIQYRCGDNIGFGKTHYGLLPYRAFYGRISKHLADQGFDNKLNSIASDGNRPAQAHFIYVIADSPSRASAHAYTSRCGVILQSLYTRLQEQFPRSVVMIKRGGDVFLDVARLAFAQVVICSASTFCLWPAISNPNIAYFPLTPLAAGLLVAENPCNVYLMLFFCGADDVGAYDNETAPHISSRFQWIREVEMIKEFKQFHPWTQVIDVLEAKA